MTTRDERDELDARLARLRAATEGLAPPPTFLAGLERTLAARTRPDLLAAVAALLRPALAAAALLGLAAAVVGWQAERDARAALAQAAVVQELAP